jgi:hypothetical protein
MLAQTPLNMLFLSVAWMYRDGLWFNQFVYI